MNQIGFHQPPLRKAEDALLSERLTIWPEQPANLTLQMRDSLVHEALGRPSPKVFELEQSGHAEDKLIFTRTWSPFRQVTSTDAVVVFREGAISFERSTTSEAATKSGFDGGDFVRRVIENCIRGVNFASTVVPETNLHVEILVSGLSGSRLIFNPHHERYDTKCATQEPILRREIVHINRSCSVAEQIKELTLNFSNEILGNYQLGSYFEYLSSEEFSPSFDHQFSSLKFDKGIFASPGIVQFSAARAG